MEKKRSKGVTFCGISLMLMSLLGMSSLFLLYGTLSQNQNFGIESLVQKIYPRLKEAGISPEVYKIFLKTVYNEALLSSSTIKFISFVITPILDVTIFIGALGLLKLKEKWRAILPSAVITSFFLRFVVNIIVQTKMILIIIYGSYLSNPNSTEFSDFLVKQFEFLQSRIIFLGCYVFIISTSIVFFLNHPKIKEQFK